MNIDELKSHARAARRDIVTMIYESGVGHPGGALSIIDVLTWIYHQEMCLDESPRTRVVMSKGHAVAAQYAMLFQLGKIARSEFNTFRQINSRLQGHPSVKSLPDVDATTGLLGQGLSVALGMAAAKKRAQDCHRVFAIIGDGEMHEGQIWESLQQASHMRMDNLVAIIDCNGFSSHDPVNEVINLEPLADKIRNFGWHVLELQNGNDMHQVADTLLLSRHLKGKPVAIIAHTTKGSGVSYMENNGDWHSKTPSAGQYQQAMEELQS
ncbi:transketolase [Citrobacter amalonaticus]|uniref:Transketolase n=1 Tax=Citrobacter amalonaticus TaxID=35703 RepID=A0A2S4RXW5_CITAM|nr:transketolase [Citrobacter amalonaticus]POT57926.1 transketolase [Citrobacter amalonaticus]POT76549.1 transketolase [Citrobacter amalonaticus]POU65629.1 transketolase [Citrobacter amalonaticus]POV05785.1 transketolase [Citrobacter amalonaticus]